MWLLWGFPLQGRHETEAWPIIVLHPPDPVIDPDMGTYSGKGRVSYEDTEKNKTLFCGSLSSDVVILDLSLTLPHSSSPLSHEENLSVLRN